MPEQDDVTCPSPLGAGAVLAGGVLAGGAAEVVAPLEGVAAALLAHGEGR